MFTIKFKLLLLTCPYQPFNFRAGSQIFFSHKTEIWLLYFLHEKSENYFSVKTAWSYYVFFPIFQVNIYIFQYHMATKFVFYMKIHWFDILNFPRFSVSVFFLPRHWVTYIHIHVIIIIIIIISCCLISSLEILYMTSSCH